MKKKTKKILSFPKNSRVKKSLTLERFFTRASVHPFDEVKWVKRDAVVGSATKKVFEQKCVEFPDFWSLNAINITVSKYFRGQLASPAREKSLREMISRITTTMRQWGKI